MAATLTQERFAGPEWIFERKFDGIRLLAFRQGTDVRLLSRNRLPQNCPPVAAAIAKLAVQDVILDGELTWGNAGVAYHVFDVPWLNGRDLTPLPLDERRAVLDALAFTPPLQRVVLLTDPKPWERACQRGLGGRDCEAARLPIRASPVAPLAEDEMRGVAGVGGRRIHGSTGRTGRLGRAACRVFRRRTSSFSRERSGRDSIRSCCWNCARGSMPSRSRSPRSRKPSACREFGRTGCVREVVVQVAFIEWTAHGKLRHSRFLGVRTDKPAREVVREMS